MLNSTTIIPYKSDGPPVQYFVGNAWNSAISIATKIRILIQRKEATIEDFLILAPSMKIGFQKEPPLRKFENELVENNIPVYYNVNDDEKSVSDSELSRGKILFCSFHQSKGLERRIVVVFNFSANYFDYYLKDKYVNRLKCPSILYVAVTRAVEHLWLIADETNDSPLPFLNLERLGALRYLPNPVVEYHEDARGFSLSSSLQCTPPSTSVLSRSTSPFSAVSPSCTPPSKSST